MAYSLLKSETKMISKNFTPFLFALNEVKKYKFFFITDWSKYVKVRKQLPDHLIDVFNDKVKIYFKSKADAKKGIKIIKSVKKFK